MREFAEVVREDMAASLFFIFLLVMKTILEKKSA